MGTVQPAVKLTASGETGDGMFGVSVALSSDGDTAIVGAPGNARVAGTQGVGAAWVFTRSGATWAQGLRLTPTGEAGAGTFGSAVALSADGDTALVGGGEDDQGHGGAWVFTRSRGAWSQQGPKLTLPSGIGTANFGRAVGLSADGNTALIGSASAAWVFTRASGHWAQQGGMLFPTGTGSQPSHFGWWLALSGDGNTALVTGIDGAWVFTRTQGSWTQQGPVLAPSDPAGLPGFGLGPALSADGSTAVIGGRGGAFVFTRTDGSWAQQGPQLIPSDAVGTPAFLTGLSGDGNTAEIASVLDDDGLGATWTFARSGSAWTQQGAKLTGSAEYGRALLGQSVALSADGTTALAGGGEDGGGIGAAWVFDLTAPPGSVVSQPDIPAPSISSISPRRGKPGTVVTITGRYLDGAILVRFGSLPATFKVVSSTKITAVAPAGLELSGSIQVRTRAGWATSKTFTVPRPKCLCPAPCCPP